MNTYGDVRLRVTQQAPGISLKLIDGWFSDRYQSILDRLKWKRQEFDTVLQTVAPYETGTVAIAEGGTAVTLIGGAFTSGMTGRAIAIDGREEWYEFTYVDGTHATIDRAYEGPTVTAAAFRVFQFIYPLPEDCKILSQIIRAGGAGPLDRFRGAQLDRSTGGRQMFGRPGAFALYMDDSSEPPRMQAQLYPAPDTVYPLILKCVGEADVPAATSATLLPWMRPSAIVAGVMADAFAHLAAADAAYWPASERQEALHEKYLADMVRTEMENRGPRPVRMASWLTRHNHARGRR